MKLDGLNAMRMARDSASVAVAGAWAYDSTGIPPAVDEGVQSTPHTRSASFNASLSPDGQTLTLTAPDGVFSLRRVLR